MCTEHCNVMRITLNLGQPESLCSSLFEFIFILPPWPHLPQIKGRIVAVSWKPILLLNVIYLTMSCEASIWNFGPVFMRSLEIDFQWAVAQWIALLPQSLVPGSILSSSFHLCGIFHVLLIFTFPLGSLVSSYLWKTWQYIDWVF